MADFEHFTVQNVQHWNAMPHSNPQENNRLHIVLALIPGFTLSNLTVALDLMRIANREAMEEVFSWDIVTLCDVPCRSSAGIEIAPTCAIGQIHTASATAVLASWSPEAGYVTSLFTWLHRIDRQGGMIGSMENGAFILAKAGLLGSAEATPHIESRDSFAEEFAPELLSKDLHILTNHRLGCTGIVSEFDLFFALIRQTQGGKLADSLADIVSYGSPETKFLSRPLHRDQLLFRSDQRIARCIELMLANQEQPLSLADIGKRAGISVWQMRRLFLRELGRTPSTYYTPATELT